ncbi:hypothetical protein C1645_866376 [Glomus cerebriforme]|uniref:Uncharacterized protein n=1 Tax=Glomus cerebriforme TaxID=658196 RepID=A0A397S2N8_9GLOM|nr:hypothetical protein C1645_866376 [Glomus cerebriforme]
MNGRIELLRLHNELCDKIDRDYQKLIKSTTSLQEISNQITKHLTDYSQEKDNLLSFYQVNRLAGKVNIEKLLEEVSSREQKISFLSKQSKKTKTDKQSKRKNNQEEYIYCQECHREIKPKAEYWYNSSKNDGYKLCSEKCYEEYYGEYCNQCANKTLTFYRDEQNPNIITCPACYEKNQQEERERKGRLTTYCQKCSAKLPENYVLDTCDNCLDKEDAEREREREQIRSQQQQLQSDIANLEQNSSKTPQQQADLDQKKQKLKDLEDKLNELETEKDNSTDLDTQIAKLQSEIRALEKKPNRTTEEEKLLTDKRKKLAELLAKKNKKENSQSPKKPIILYVSLTVGGIILLVILATIIFRRKKK